VLNVAEGTMLPIWLESMDGQPSALRLAVIQAGGAFALDDLPRGGYRIHSLLALVGGHLLLGAAQAPAQRPDIALFYTVRLRDDDPVLLNRDRPVDVSMVSVRAVMSGNVRGTIEHAEEFTGIPAVVLVPAEDNPGNYGVLVTANPDGTFAASGLASGSYYAAAFPSLDLAGLRDPDLLRRVVAADTKVSVEVGSTTELKLKAGAWPE